jgi:hypothetical protein
MAREEDAQYGGHHAYSEYSHDDADGDEEEYEDEEEDYASDDFEDEDDEMASCVVWQNLSSLLTMSV